MKKKVQHSLTTSAASSAARKDFCDGRTNDAFPQNAAPSVRHARSYCRGHVAGWDPGRVVECCPSESYRSPRRDASSVFSGRDRSHLAHGGWDERMGANWESSAEND